MNNIRHIIASLLTKIECSVLICKYRLCFTHSKTVSIYIDSVQYSKINYLFISSSGILVVILHMFAR